jgi:PIN domain nuclease of toxin-antitoxin system
VFVLDTHVWVWTVDGDTRHIGRRARQTLVRAESADRIRISPVSIFEVAALCTPGASVWLARSSTGFATR